MSENTDLPAAELAAIRERCDAILASEPQLCGSLVACDFCGLLYDEMSLAADGHFICGCGRLGQRMDTATTHDVATAMGRLLAEIDRLTEKQSDLANEVASVLLLMDGLAEQWGDEGVFRRCRDRLRAALSAETGKGAGDAR